MNSPADRVVALYDGCAGEWDADRRRGLRPDGSPFEKAWLDSSASLLQPGSSVLDLGCGGGIPITQYLVHHNFEVTGVDASRRMIELWRRRFPKQCSHVADMRHLELRRRFCGLIAWDSFFHLPHSDQRLMFRIFAAHAMPGAALLFTSGTSHGEAIGALNGAPLYHASLDPEEYRALLKANGFDVRVHVVEDPECHRTAWLAQCTGRHR